MTWLSIILACVLPAVGWLYVTQVIGRIERHWADDHERDEHEGR